MKGKPMKKALLLCLLLFCVGGEIFAQEKSDVRKNVELYLEKVGLSGKVEIFRERPDRVYANDLSEGKILDILHNDKKHWARDMYKSSRGHGGALKSWRYKRSPSMQITKVVQDDGTWFLEIDIDRWFTHWKRPDLVFIHIVAELVPHFSWRHLGMKFMPRYTKQSQIKKSLENWK